MPPPPAVDLARCRRSFGNRLRELREAADLSQERMAELAGLDRKTVSRIETGTHSPVLDGVFALCAVLDTHPVELFRW
jgi:transcriptional regulator with XRE-family HTH domain